MTARSTAALLAASLLAPALVHAQKLDKEEKAWLDTVRPLMLPNEEKTFRGLKEKADRAEFQKIFWARRDPSLDTPENEFEAEYLEAFAKAEREYRVMGRSGADTDCGRVFLLLGKPDEVKKEGGGVGPGNRVPETWTYRDRPGQTFTGGKAEIALDETCSLPPGARLKEQLDRVAEARIVRPNLAYKFEKNGRLTKLADQLPKPTPAQALLKSPRQDFPLAAQATYLKVQDGGTALTGLVRGDATGLAVQEAGGTKTVKVVVAANVAGEDGKVAAFTEEPKAAPVKDGHFVASFRMNVKPGKYTLRAGAIEEKSGKGSLAELVVEAPDLNTGELSAASVLVLEDVQEFQGNADPNDPFSAFTLAQARLIPRFAGTFAKSEAVSFFYQVYDLKTDEAGKASAVASVAMLREAGRTTVAKAGDQAIETPVGGNVIGPVPLDKYEPGKYLVQLKVRDNLAKKDLTQEVQFEVKP
jgi:GWxTD domain-containing protein